MTRAKVLITGISQRVGLHLATTFLQRGWEVLGTYRTVRPSLDALRASGALVHRCDFYEDDQVGNLIEWVRGETGVLRAVVHNASDWLPESADLPSAEIMRRMMAVHVTAPYRLNLALAPLLRAWRPGPADIIHMGDYVSGRGSRKHVACAALLAA